MSVMPITPEKIVAVKRQEIPDKVIEIFNDLITIGHTTAWTL